MLRVGLTGGLGSGKSTVAAMLAGHGAHVLLADEIGRELMQPGQAVYDAIVQAFGEGVVLEHGSLDRRELARLAFTDGRIEELNAIVHPAVIAEQARRTEAIAAGDPEGVVVVESALILATKHGDQGGVLPPEPWRVRFDWLVLVTADESRKIERFVKRSAAGRTQDAEAMAGFADEARRRLARQMTDEQKAATADAVLPNNGSLEELAGQVDALWTALRSTARRAQGARGR